MKLRRISLESFDEDIDQLYASKKCICFCFSLNDEDKEFFYVTLAPIDELRYETHSSDLPMKKRGMGFGVFSYSTVFQYCLDNQVLLCSSRHRSESSERLWRSQRINNLFKITKNEDENRYILELKKEIINCQE